jgi:hypothetical protein
MKRNIMLVSVGLAFFAGFLLLGPSVAPAGNAKVQICHLPPGNPANFHTITISENALPAHLAHGDVGGACDEHCETLCDDGDACTSHTCDLGGCNEPQPVDCDDSNLCTTDSCNPASGCVYAPVPCYAPDLCTISACAPDTGQCVDTPVLCSEGAECNPDTGACEASGDCEERCEAQAVQAFDQCIVEGGDPDECARLARELLIKCIADNCEAPCDDCPAGEVWDPEAAVCRPSQSTFTEAQWQITGNGVDPRAGTIDTSAPGSTPSVEVFAFPPGSNYSVDMSTTPGDGGLTCAGESIIDVHAGETTETRLILDCMCSMQQFPGDVRVGGRSGTGTCTLLTGGVVSPLETSVGNDIDLAAIAANAGGDPIEYSWTATGGFIDDPSASSTTYVCAEVGAHTITISVSDDGFDQCLDRWTVSVTCVNPT